MRNFDKYQKLWDDHEIKVQEHFIRQQELLGKKVVEPANSIIHKDKNDPFQTFEANFDGNLPNDDGAKDMDCNEDRLSDSSRNSQNYTKLNKNNQEKDQNQRTNKENQNEQK